MTFFMISGMVCFLAVISLLWFCRGFSQDLRKGNTIGLFVRPVTIRPVVSRPVTPKAVLKQNIQRVVRMSARREQFSNSYPPDPNTDVPITARSGERRQMDNKAGAAAYRIHSVGSRLDTSHKSQVQTRFQKG
ncbi:MAG: hypothetical protein JWN42_2883 [Candidatus Angelobacter sp.]|nr:hypothetical protein [Candidatus Angelobacter sp.]